MNRAELRRVQRDESKKAKTFVLTQEQIDSLKKEAINEAVDKAFILMLALPLEVLLSEEYWMKSAKKRLPKFMDEILKLYKAYESGNIDLKDMEDDLWEYGGIRVGGK